MIEFKINKIVTKLRKEIPSELSLVHEALNRCEQSLLSGNGLCGSEHLFFQRLNGFKELPELYMTFEESVTKRKPTQEEIIFWRNFNKSNEFSEFLRLAFSKISPKS